MDISSFPRFARQNVIVLAGCMAGLVIFASIALLPDIHKHRHQIRAIKELQVQLDQQNDMNFLYQKLEAILANQGPGEAVSPFIEPQAISAKETDQVVLTLQKLAKKNGVVLDDVRPELASGKLVAKQMRVQAVMHGHLDKHRVFLLDLLKEPYVEEIEDLVLETNGSDISLRIIMVINIA